MSNKSRFDIKNGNQILVVEMTKYLATNRLAVAIGWARISNFSVALQVEDHEVFEYPRPIAVAPQDSLTQPTTHLVLCESPAGTWGDDLGMLANAHDKDLAELAVTQVLLGLVAQLMLKPEVLEFGGEKLNVVTAHFEGKDLTSRLIYLVVPEWTAKEWGEYTKTLVDWRTKALIDRMRGLNGRGLSAIGKESASIYARQEQPRTLRLCQAAEVEALCSSCLAGRDMDECLNRLKEIANGPHQNGCTFDKGEEMECTCGVYQAKDFIKT